MGTTALKPENVDEYKAGVSTALMLTLDTIALGDVEVLNDIWKRAKKGNHTYILDIIEDNLQI